MDSFLSHFKKMFSFISFGLMLVCIALECEETETLSLDVISYEDLPEYFGFADSHFQSCGLGTKYTATPTVGSRAECDWNKWLNEDRIEGIEDPEEQFPRFFVDYLDNPEQLIRILKEMKVSAYRFSLERSIIEPIEGQFDEMAIRRYRNLIEKLKEEGIEPWVTLRHFVDPEWFAAKGGFEKEENISNFVQYSIKMIQRFPEITYWMTFNEPAVDAFQKYIRGVYPPGIMNDLDLASKVIKHILMAHCKIYDKAKQIAKQLQIGITHQWLKFIPYSEWNPIEKFLAYSLSQITHYSVLDFFRTGEFSLKMPFVLDVHFKVDPEKWNQKPLCDFMGIQSYGFPRLKAGIRCDGPHPGYQIINIPEEGKYGLTFGATCEPGGKVASFGVPFYPEDLREVLIEASTLDMDLAITENGCDANMQHWGEKEPRLDNETQREYYERTLPIVAEFTDRMIGFFSWTLLRDHLEWDRGDIPKLGVVSPKAKLDDKGVRRIVDYDLSLAGELLQEAYETKQGAME